jgi:sugar phosphate isomerase/epimerase
MLNQQNAGASSVDQLIANLEHVEESEIRSDIRANVRAELKRMKRNVSAILAFTSTSHAPSADNAQLAQAISELRRECILINATISKTLILQTLHAAGLTKYTSRAADEYAAMSQAMRQLCALAAPLRVQELADAL